MQIYFGCKALWHFDVAENNVSYIIAAIIEGGAKFGQGLDGPVPCTRWKYYALVRNMI